MAQLAGRAAPLKPQPRRFPSLQPSPPDGEREHESLQRAQLALVKLLLRWLPLVVIAGPLASAGALAWLAKRAPSTSSPAFPPPLVPAGATLTSTRTADEHCYAHTIATFSHVSPDVVAEWARSLELPCDGPSPCTAWSTNARSDPFWSTTFREPQGLDTVDARLDGGVLTVDWGDYLCSGPN